MKLIIAGKRDLCPRLGFIEDSIRLLRPYRNGPISEVVSGGANGIDSEGEHWASHYKVPVKRFLPDWNTHGRAAGPIRNAQMADYGDALLLIWDGKSRGSASMKSEMMKRGKPIYEVILKGLPT